MQIVAIDFHPVQHREMATLRIHSSLAVGLTDATAIELIPGRTLTTDDADRLMAWSLSCDNPAGQRAALARMVSNLIVLGHGATLTAVSQHSTSFWEATAR